METSQQVKKSWKDNISTFIAITTLVLAACATLASFKAAGYGNKMVLAQNQASDQWAYYQAKSIKETTYEVERDTMALAAQQAGNPELYKAKIAEYNREITRYQQEKEDITKAAKRLEQERDNAQHFNGGFGQALIFLQIGILLSSLASINKQYMYWYIGLAVGGVGIIVFLYNFVSAAV
ncbi:DUF4337 domain-containing protein [Sporomusa acidovorans]|uniref:DUF4337 domain-containing protein n=1 Tax=Sporomusa acidovorans (strain ATCC 49682 / DSM 3132 / Mol) TaxID=1123286 RepID=A0ABZ3IZG9_SPOA4|nr:DUF4337 domain-containing protein [Sporomusa acidovorans]OZC14114.1 hypothetical protein SPACI_52890 [Sporomusa acidovorans DSM 3132]SDE68669.1 protein of unknown function [Sporomusa acidovorans]